MPTSPLAAGSVSLRVYPLDLPPAEVVREVQTQARLAEEAGFDGCMTSEHHGGFPNYLPNPLLAATWILEATERIWAAPCPVVLALRPVTQVIEDITWTYHRFPGRVGIGVCAGALPVDFEMAGVPFEEMFPRLSGRPGGAGRRPRREGGGPDRGRSGGRLSERRGDPCGRSRPGGENHGAGRPTRGLRPLRLVADDPTDQGALRRLRRRRAARALAS